MNGQFSGIENRLCEAYRAAAETIEPDGISTLNEQVTVIVPGPAELHSAGVDRAGVDRAGRRRTGRGGARRRGGARGRVLLPLAAAAAIVAIVAGVPALRSGLLPGASHPAGAGPGTGAATGTGATHGRGAAGREGAAPGKTARARVSTIPLPPGTPPFFVTSDGGPGTTLYVYRTATAQVVATVGVPRSGDDYYAISASSNPLSYVVAIGHAHTCGTRLYWLNLKPGGQFAHFTPLEVPTLPEDVFSIALNADGDHLAYAGEYCTNPSGGLADIGYVNLATGTISRWTTPKQEDVGSLSVSADGAEIGFVVGPTKLFPPEAATLATDAPSGTVAERAQVIVSATRLTPAGTVPEGAVLGRDGRTMYVCGAGVQLGSTAPPTTSDPLVTFSGTSLTHTMRLAAAGSCGLSLDPSGRFLLAQTSGGYGQGTPAVQLIDLATGKAITLPVPAASLEQGDQVFW